MKADKYRQSRGGWSHILDIAYEECGDHVCFYQKDGPEPLKRMYTDRMLNVKFQGNSLTYNNCNQTIGVRVIYEKENRPAYRLFQGAITKKIIKQSDVPH